LAAFSRTLLTDSSTLTSATPIRRLPARAALKSSRRSLDSRKRSATRTVESRTTSTAGLMLTDPGAGWITSHPCRTNGCVNRVYVEYPTSIVGGDWAGTSLTCHRRSLPLVGRHARTLYDRNDESRLRPGEHQRTRPAATLPEGDRRARRGREHQVARVVSHSPDIPGLAGPSERAAHASAIALHGAKREPSVMLFR